MIKKVPDKQENNCSWCHHDINAQSNEIIGSPDTVFCSENCFIFWRRASFKRAKTCDFCKNVRNAVSYVDFNDGTTQLQFCSDKCLNQYKMQIFCRETQAHLELNPHLKDKNESGEGLITPDLWLKNCRTRSPTPDDYERSKSSSPMTIAEEKLVFSKIIDTKQTLPSSSSKIISTVSNLAHNDNAIDAGKKPIINVLPSSKLLSRNMLHSRNLRKRRISTRLAISNKANQNSNDNNTGTESIMNTNFPADLRAKIHSQMNNNPKSIQSTSFNRPPLQQFMQRPPINLFKYRFPFPMPSQRIPLPPQNQQPLPEDSNINPLPPINSVLPPPVILVPYPIPLPIIIPIPLPLTAFMRAYQKKETELPTNKNDNESHEEVMHEKMNENEKPLDLSSEQSVHESDKIYLTQYDDDCDDDTDDTNIIVDSNYLIEKNTIDNKESKYENAEVNIKKTPSKDIHERNRPLRKRKIISTEDDDNH
ncbi:hypothetical protein ACKWTF_007425 [Chironomus riparius]